MGEPEVLLPGQQPHPAEPRTAQQSAARRDPPPRQLLPVTFAAPTEANIEQLRVLNLAIFPISYQDRVYKDILACGDVTQLAYNNNVLVGAVGCRLERRPEGIKMYILTLGVLAPYRGMGVGSALLARCLAYTQDYLPEVVEAYLHVQTSNAEAIRFYQRFGFGVGETIPGYYKRLDPPDAVVLSRRLSSGGSSRVRV